ncbi:MarR family winged helix-turn-helix transcriptional regulator [Pseudoponticoccus marisrubri]|uniref:MarR family transcriptional regulator n=1 Tax=Pseudoponticoccus marisrubri TaxID=1685382 RepID=A0A0W7WG21_9RHOB|nr:MarR family transcriptional regulator [Pseudoponticoccus marisrubri]KUF09506.1 MarR family transcriptional regulator [Pseudoponticoccus marisrubri]
MSQTPASPDTFLCFSLASAARAMNRVYAPLLEPLGLTYPQYMVLVALWARDAQPVGAIGAQLALETNTLTPLLKRMSEAGLVTRTRSAADERQVIVTLTGRGRALQEAAAHIPDAILAATGLPADEAAALTRQVNALRDRLAAVDTDA